MTDNIAAVSLNWHHAREKHAPALLQIETEDNFKAVQKFLYTVHTLTSEKRLGRIMYHAVK